MSNSINSFLAVVILVLAAFIIREWTMKQTNLLVGLPTASLNREIPVKVNTVPCVSKMDPTNFQLLTNLAQRYNQMPFDHLVIPRLRFHFDERFVPQSPSRDSSATILLFLFQSDEDWGQHELIDASLKVWFGSDAGNVAVIDIASKSLDAIQKTVYETIQECEYTIIRFKNAELTKTSDIFQLLQDVRHLSLPNKKVLDGSKAIYFFEHGISKKNIQREDVLRLIGQYRKVVTGDPWQEYFDTVGLVQNITDTMFNSTFSHMLGSRMRVSVIPFLPIPDASIKTYVEDKAFRTLEPNTKFPKESYLDLVKETNPGIKVYKYIDDTDCKTSPFSLPCLRAQCGNLTCMHKKIQVTTNAATCTC